MNFVEWLLKTYSLTIQDFWSLSEEEQKAIEQEYKEYKDVFV